MMPILFLAAAAAAAAHVPVRTPLATIPVAPAKAVTRVETTRVVFAPGQAMPRHKHNVPVVCFVTKGMFEANVEGVPIRHVRIGDVTVEPAGAIVNYFRNESRTAPAELLCAALAGDEDKVLNVMLDAAPR